MKSGIALIITLNLLLNLDQTRARLRIIYDRVEAIEVPKESKLQMEYMHITPSNNSFFQAKFQVLQEFGSSNLKITAEVIRCLVGEAPDTCEYLITLIPPNACMTINAENMAWSDISNAFTPKFKCPFKKGTYVANAITFDANNWNIFPLDNIHLKATIKLFDGDVLTMGFITHAHFNRVH